MASARNLVITLTDFRMARAATAATLSQTQGSEKGEFQNDELGPLVENDERYGHKGDVEPAV
jgi:hypothetical protein